jgi:cold shock CspA family protein
MQGNVRWYSAQGFGFIDPVPTTSVANAEHKAIYYHIADVENRAIFKVGDAVTFDVTPTLKGPKCINVRAADTKEAIQNEQPRAVQQ